MADIQSEKVVFEIDVSSYLEQLRVLNVQIQQAKENQKELFEAAAKGDKQAGIQLQEVNAFLKIQQKEYQGVQRALVGFTTSQKDAADTVNFANNSIKTNRALLSQLTEQYNGLKKPGAELTNTIKRLSDTLKDQEKAIGDTRRNVGNYKDDILSAFSGLRGIGGAVDPIRNLGAAFKGAGGGVQGFSAALATTGLPLIITGVNALIDVFRTYEPVAEAVERATAGLSAGFSALVRGNNILETARQTAQLTGELQDLNDQQSLADLNAAKNRKEVVSLLIQSKNAFLTFGQQLSKVREANKLEKQSSEESLKVLRETVSKEEEIFATRVGLNQKYTKEFAKQLLERLITTNDYRNKNLMEEFKITNDDLKILRDRRQKIIDAEANTQELQDRLANREAAIVDKINAKRQKDLDDEKAANEKAEAERQRQRKIQLDNLLKNAKENEDALKQLRENRKLQEGLQALTGKSQAQLDAEFEAAVLKDRFLTFREFIDAQSKEYERQRREKEQADKEAIDAEKQKQDELKKIREEELKYQQELAKQEQELTKARIEAAGTLGGALIGFIGDIAEATGANAAFQKALAIFDIGVKTAVALAGAIQQAQSVPFPANIAAIATGIAAVLGGIGGAIATLSKAGDAPKPPKFAEGGVIDIDGKPHSQGGTPIHVNGRQVAEAEKGEKLFILKKTASQQINALSAFNQMFGGRSLTGSPVRFAAEGGAIDLSPATRSGDGGFFSRSVKTNNEMAQLSRAVMEGVRNMPAPVVSVKEINRVQSSKDRSVKVSELG